MRRQLVQAENLKSVHQGNFVFDSRVDTLAMKNGEKVELPVAGMFEIDSASKLKVWPGYFYLSLEHPLQGKLKILDSQGESTRCALA